LRWLAAQPARIRLAIAAAPKFIRFMSFSSSDGERAAAETVSLLQAFAGLPTE
jgi:hypothetical protein